MASSLQSARARGGAVVSAARRATSLLLLLAAFAASLATAYDPLDIPIRPPVLPSVPRLRVPASGSASVIIKPADVSIRLSDVESLNFTTPRYVTPGVNDCSLQAPALVLEATCSSFSIELNNQLPFQPFHSCPAGGDSFINGPKDFQWTNLHTHGLKVDPGANNVSNLCEPGFADAGLADPTISIQEYYCNPDVSSQQLCRVRGDNVLVIDRPLTNATFTYGVAQHPGATIRYTYPLQAVVPGVGWYHPHQHGSVGIQTPTSGAPLIIPESALPGGIRSLYAGNGNRNGRECDRLLQVLQTQPLEESTFLQFYGIWFRNTTVPDSFTPDDDSIPFLGLDGDIAPKSSLLYDEAGEPIFFNPAGRDWALVNGAFQPKVSITASRYSRWQLLNTMTMKWLDLTIQKVNEDNSLSPVDSCKFWLLGRDGVPLPKVPRQLSSRPVGSARNFSDIILGPANRADVLIKCDVPGTYVLASGAGPFHTNTDACRATHCECFGDPPANAAVLRSANNLFNGTELDAAVLAVVEVLPLPLGVKPQADFRDHVCKARLDRIAYLDYQSYPKPPAPTQCFSFMNQAYGGFCSVNNQLFPDGVAYVEQGSQQIWNIRDITFHPFHLHESPVRLTSLPRCTTDVTNNFQVGDWMDTILLPTCQTGCNWTATGSGLGACGNNVSVCDQATIQWLATDFAAPVQPRAKDLCKCGGGAPSNPQPKPPCQERVSVFHCHILPHEDEGCMAVVRWTCPGFTPPASAFPARCPSTYTLDCPSPPPPPSSFP